MLRSPRSPRCNPTPSRWAAKETLLFLAFRRIRGINANQTQPRRAAPHMTGDEFRRVGHELVDQLASLLEAVPRGPVTREQSSTAVREALGLGGALLEQGDDPAVFLPEATRRLFANSLFDGHPRFFGYITSSPAPLGMLDDFIAAAAKPQLRRLDPLASRNRNRSADGELNCRVHRLSERRRWSARVRWQHGPSPLPPSFEGPQGVPIEGPASGTPTLGRLATGARRLTHSIRRHRHAPRHQQTATQTVLEQAELCSAEWTAA